MQSKFFRTGLIVLFVILGAVSAQAAKKRGGKGAFAGGSLSVGLGISLATAEQDSLNQLVRASKTSNNSTAGELSSAIEYMAHVTFKFSNGIVGIQLRPSYFTQSSTGSGTDGSYKYDLSGLVVFPLVRIIPLSNDFIDFFIQAGLGYGNLTGSIQNGSRNVSYKGGNFGTQIGLGADFCFIPSHCFGVEGNYRYLPIQRNIVTSAGGGNPNGVSQAISDRELEDSGTNDISTKLSGISGLFMYTMNF